MIAQIGVELVDGNPCTANGDTWLRKRPTCARFARETVRRAAVDRRANVNDDVVEMDVVPDAVASDVLDEDVKKEADGEGNIKKEDSEEESLEAHPGLTRTV